MSANSPQPVQPLTDVISSRSQAIWFRIGTLWESMDDPVRALSAYETVLRHNQAHFPAMVKAGVLRQRDHLPTSVSYLLSAVGLQPMNGPAWASLAYSYVMSGEFDKAYHAYYNALARQADRTDPNLWHGVGLLYDRLGLLDDAIAAFGAVLGLAPSFEKTDEVYYALGVIYKEKAEYNAALAYMSKVVSLNSTPGAIAEAYYQMGVIQELVGSANNAAEAYATALQSQEHVKAMQSFAWLKHKMGKSNEAISLLQRALQIDDSDGSCSYLLGRVYMANNEYRVAYDNYQRAVHLDGNNANYWCSIAALYYQRQQHRDAMDAFSRAMDINANIPEIWFDLGTLYETYNQYNDALNAYRRASELQPRSTRFVDRYSAIQQVMHGGVAPQLPSGKPASDDILPIPSAVQRPRCKSDAPVRYGPLPPPPDPTTIQNKLSPPPEQMKYEASTAGGVAIAHRAHNSGAGPANIVNGMAVIGGREPFSNGASLRRLSNEGGTHSTSVAASVPGHLRTGRGGNMTEAVPNGRPSPMRLVSRQEGLSFGNRNITSSNGASQLMIHTRPPHHTGIPRVREPSFAPVSPVVGRAGGRSLEQSSIPARSQEQPAMRLQGSPPMGTSVAVDSTPRSQPQPLQSGPSITGNGSAHPERSHREDSTWRARTERASAESRSFPEPYMSRPEVSSVNRGAETNSQIHKPGSSRGPGYPALRSSVPHFEGPEQAMKIISMGSGPIPAICSPAAPSNLSHGREPSQQIPKYADMQQSSSAAGNSTSALPAARKINSPNAVGTSSGPKPSNSDEPSRRSVSSSHERPNRSPFSSKDVIPEGSPRGSLAEKSGERDIVGLNVDGRAMGSADNLEINHGEAAPRPHHSSTHLDSSRQQSEFKASAEKAGPPVDEEMLPKLPPLPSPRDEPDTGTSEGMKKANAPVAHAKDLSPRGALAAKDRFRGIELRSMPVVSSAEKRATLDNRQRGLSENEISGGPNDLRFNRNPQSASHQQIYRGSEGPKTSRPSDGIALRRTSSERVGSSDVDASNESNGLRNVPHGIIEPVRDVASTTALTHNENENQKKVELPGRNNGPMRQNSSPGALGTVEEVTVSQPERVRNHHIADPATGPRRSPGNLEKMGEDERNGQRLERLVIRSLDNRGRSSDSAGNEPLGIVAPSSLRADAMSREKEDTRGNGNGMLREGGRAEDDQSPVRSVPRVSSIRNPFGSGTGPSFSKSLSRVGTTGPIALPAVKTAIASDTTARTANSEGLRLRSIEDERLQGKGAVHGEVSMLGKRNSPAYENGSLKHGEGAEYGRFLPEPSVIGPSVGKQLGTKDDIPHRHDYEGAGKPYLPGREGKGYAEERQDLKRGKQQHTLREPYSSSRYNSDL